MAVYLLLAHYMLLFQECGNDKMLVQGLGDKEMAIIYKSKEKFTCPKEQITLYLWL